MQFDNWKRLPPKRNKAFVVRAYIYQCKDLMPADDDGVSDPYVEMWSHNQEKAVT